MDSRYTNRDRYLDGLSNEKLAKLIEGYSGAYGCKFCPFNETDKCVYHEVDIDNIDFDDLPECESALEKWLGEKS